MISFALGVSTLIIALGFGARETIRSKSQSLRGLAERSKPIIGGTFILVGVALFFRLHHVLEGWLVSIMPYWLQDLSVIL